MMIAQRSAKQNQSCQRQGVDIDHPLHFGRAGAGAVANGGQGDVEDRAVDEAQRRGRDGHAPRPARIVPGLGGRAIHAVGRGGFNRSMRLRNARRAASTSQIDRATRTSAITAAAIGLAMASASRPPVATSSAVDTTTFENGSGLVLTKVRAPALPAWAMNAAPPPSRKLPICQAGSPASMMARLSNAPPSGRMKLWTASQALSTQAILSAKNSASVPTPAMASTQLLASTSSACSWSGRATQPNFMPSPV